MGEKKAKTPAKPKAKPKPPQLTPQELKLKARQEAEAKRRKIVAAKLVNQK